MLRLRQRRPVGSCPGKAPWLQRVWADWRRSNNAEPEFTDAEVLTIALMQGCLGVATLKKAYKLMAENHASAFPNLPTYKRWTTSSRPAF